ncbi:hypothetical protein GWL_38950 [Herbaspirillum sp. GW103]|nr:hypothetical protein GWL_38950 [Herbaspirillum sp. GW103]
MHGAPHEWADGTEQAGRRQCAAHGDGQSRTPQSDDTM